jgi:Holliday junction resolvase RusA-like endonuclease
MRILQIKINGRIPAKKNSRPGFSVRGRNPPSAAYTAWHKVQSLELLKYKGMMLDRVDMQLEFWMPDNRQADLDNKLTSVLDLMKDLKIIKDDCWQCVPTIYMRCAGVDKLNPRVEIWIREIGK